MTNAFERWTVAYANWIVRWRWLVVVASLMAVFAAAAGGQFLSFTSDYRVFFGKENPQLAEFEALQDIYTKSDNILFVLVPESGTAVEERTMTVVRDLTEESWRIPYAIRVDSLTNYQHTEAEEDDLIVADLIEYPDELANAEEAKRIAEIALAEPVLIHRLISANAGATGVNVTLQLPPDDNVALMDAVTAAERLKNEIEQAYPEIRVEITGLAALSAAFPRASQADMMSLIPAMFGIIMITLLVFLRSITGTLVTMVITILSVIAAMGFAGWSGIRLTPPSAMAPNIILTIAIADCVHILVTMFHEMRSGRDRRAAIIESIRVNMQPVFLTSLTTIIGFLSLNFSESPPFHDLGNMSAAGVTAAFFLSVALLPALMAIIPLKKTLRDPEKSAAMDRLSGFVIAQRNRLLPGMSLVVIAFIAFVPRIELDDRFIQYFDHSVDFRVATDFTLENMTGVYQVEYSITHPESGGISEPDYLAGLEGFANWWRDQPGVMHVNSFTDVIKRVNKSMHGDDQAWYRLPENREMAAQYLLLYEMSLPYGLDLNSQINVDKSATRMIITLNDMSSGQMQALKEAGDQWLADNAPGLSGLGTGTTIMFSYIADRNIKSMLGGTLVAFVVISATLVLALRSFKLGAVSLIPNLVPVFVAFGVWGLTVQQVGLAASVVTATSLGLIVDATVHFLSKYNRARREKSLDPVQGVAYAFSTVGAALWITTAILVCGFAVLSFSSFKVNGDMGMLTALTIAIALIIDFLLLPPLLMWIDRKEIGKAKSAPTAQPAPAE